MSDTEPIIIPRKVRIVRATAGHMFPLDSIVLLTGGPDRDGDFVATGTGTNGLVDWWYLKPVDFVYVPMATPLGLPEPEAGPVEPEAPEPALKAALLEDHDTHATAEDQSRDVLRRELAAAVGNSSYDVSPMLAAVDRYVDSLSQAQVEYATEAVNVEWLAQQVAEQEAFVRRTALEQAVEVAKAGIATGMTAPQEHTVKAAEAFYAFLTGTEEQTSRGEAWDDGFDRGLHYATHDHTPSGASIDPPRNPFV